MSLIVLATSHRRYDKLERQLGEIGLEVLRVRNEKELVSLSHCPPEPSYVFFPHWSWKISPEIFEKFECVIFHMTDLPYGRGGSPLQNLIIRGHRDTQLTALRCVTDVDAGPIYLKRPLSLLGSAEEILLRAAELMAEMIKEIVDKKPTPAPQCGEVVAFKRRRQEDGDLKGLADIGQVYDFIRMLDAENYPPAFLETDQFRFEFSRASLRPDAVLADVRIVRKTP